MSAKKRKLTKRQLRLRKRRIKVCVSLGVLLSLFVYIGVHVFGDGFNFAIKQDSIVEKEKLKKTYRGVVALDPGHGGMDSGSISYNGIYEKDITLEMAKAVGKYLEAEDIKVIYTRIKDHALDEDEVIDLDKRVAIGKKADVFVSLHTNATEVYEDGIRGYEIWVEEVDSASYELAKQINEQMDLVLPNGRGLKDEANRSLHVLEHTEMPAILIELGFMSDAWDVSWMTNPTERDKVAKAIALGILIQFK